MTSIVLPKEGFKIKIFVDEGLGNDPDPQKALKAEIGREVLPMIEEEYLEINDLPAYRAVRQIMKGETSNAGHIFEVTRTDIEYSYLYNQNLYRVFIEIDNNDPQETIGVFDQVARTFKLVN